MDKNILEKKTIDMLTEDSVSILTQKFIEIDGEQVQVGNNHRRAYVNSKAGRTDLAASEPEDIVVPIMVRWGESPTVEDPDGQTNQTA